MANRIQDTKVRYSIILFIALSSLLCNRFVYGKTTASSKNIELLKHKGTAKTIESESGDVIDCVDIYQQPAFDHPALKNHTIQMEPSEIPSRINMKKNESNKFEVLQAFLTTVECPVGTVPIKRIHKDDILIKDHFPLNDGHHLQANNDLGHHEFAAAWVRGSEGYNGAYAAINIWNPRVDRALGESSIAQIWITSGQSDNINTIEAGWMARAGQNAPTFFVYWTSDNYRHTGCINLACPGFVQTNSKMVLGGSITPVSTYNNKDQHEITISIERNTLSGNWWLYVQDMTLGYWPDTIFTSFLGKSADGVSWGGQVLNTNPNGHHTTTQMGSGHFASEGYGKASFIRSLGYRDTNGKLIGPSPRELARTVTSSACYDIRVQKGIMYYGGPGLSSTCP